MKRSEINKAIEWAINTLHKNHIRLPAFGYWDMAQWRRHIPECGALCAAGLGWDVTDFGSGDFARTGAALFTLRNGTPEGIGTPYAEKLILQQCATEQQIPYHYHRDKTEDIINRGGGVLALQLYNAAPGDTLDTHSRVEVAMDGRRRSFAPGEVIQVEPGASITLTPRLFHRFYALAGEGDLVAGEVSSLNDDATDNIFLEARPRFASIEEDEAPLYPLCNEYATIF